MSSSTKLEAKYDWPLRSKLRMQSLVARMISSRLLRVLVDTWTGKRLVNHPTVREIDTVLPGLSSVRLVEDRRRAPIGEDGRERMDQGGDH